MIEARLTAFERNTDLYAAGNLSARAVALDAIQQVYQLLQLHQRDAQWGRYLRTLRQQARTLEERLRQAEGDFFQTLRCQIRSGEHSAETLRRLEELGLSQQVRFLNFDACNVDYTDGTVFFMYTPFTGKLLDAVLATLARQARHRPITLCTYGACTLRWQGSRGYA